MDWKKGIHKYTCVVHTLCTNARAIQNQNLHVFHLRINFNLIYVRACVLLVYCCLNRTIAIKSNYAVLHADRNIGHILTHTNTQMHTPYHVSHLRSLIQSLIHSSFMHDFILLSTEKYNLDFIRAENVINNLNDCCAVQWNFFFINQFIKCVAAELEDIISELLYFRLSPVLSL